jgi:hypothetical protein
VRICGNVVRNEELGGNRAKQGEYQALMHENGHGTMSGFAGHVRFRSSKRDLHRRPCYQGCGTLSTRFRTESPQVWRGGTRNPSLTLTEAGAWKPRGRFLGVIRLAEKPLQRAFKPPSLFWGGHRVAFGCLWGRTELPSLCLVYAQYMALRWLRPASSAGLSNLLAARRWWWQPLAAWPDRKAPARASRAGAVGWCLVQAADGRLIP